MIFTTERIAPFLIEQVEAEITNFLADGPDDEVVGECVDANQCVVARALNQGHLSPFRASACQEFIGFYTSIGDDRTEQYRAYCSDHVRLLIHHFDALIRRGVAPTRTTVREIWQSIIGGF